MADSRPPFKARPTETEEQRQKRLAYHREWMRKFRKAHPEKTREVAARYLEKNSHKVRACQKRRYQEKREQIIAQACEYSRANREKINARNRARRAADPEKAKAASRACYLRRREKDKAYRAGKRSELAAYMRHKRNTDPQFAMADRLRRRINQAISRSNTKKCGGLAETAGCDLAALVLHIESQFLPGMSWDNRRSWHIDHIVPLSAFDLTDPEQQKVAFHFTNLRPIWAGDNLRKHASIPTGQRQLFWDQSHVERIAKKVKKKTA